MLVGLLPDSICPDVMETEQIPRDFGLIVEAGLVSRAIAVLLRLPDMMVLVAVGALIGPSVLGARGESFGTLIGVVAGVTLSYLASTCRGGVRRESPDVAILAVVTLGYFSVETVGSSGYLAAFVMGLIVGNTEFLHLGQHDEHADLLEGFVSQVAEIAVLLAPQTNDDTLFTIHDR
jgi:NhaP-type Na+/H+ and K+/H+ antiporter